MKVLNISIIKKFEGLRLKAYLCPAGLWTIGYGHTKNVKKGDIITEYRADKFLLDDLMWVETTVNTLVKVLLTQNQYDALVSLVFNIGGLNFKKSTLLRELNMGNYDSASDQFLLWRKSEGKVLNGLERRRAEEKRLFDDE